MADHHFAPGEAAEAFRYASHWWRSIVGAVDEHQWDQPGLGEWTVRELVAHTDRAYKTVVEYLAGEPKDTTWIPTAAAYFRTVLAEETPHVHIAARGKEEARLHSDWVTATDEMAAQAEALVVDTPGHTVVHLFVGEMALDQYLATRVVELVVHGLDLSEAIGLPVNPPPAAVRLVIEVLLDLSGDANLALVIKGLTGRTVSMPPANVLL